VNQGPAQGVLFEKKSEGRKSRDTVPLTKQVKETNPNKQIFSFQSNDINFQA
jgi:hypothetical protein